VCVAADFHMLVAVVAVVVVDMAPWVVIATDFYIVDSVAAAAAAVVAAVVAAHQPLEPVDPKFGRDRCSSDRVTYSG